MIHALFVIVALALAGAAHAQCEDDSLHDAAASLLLSGRTDAASITAALREAGSDVPHAQLRRGSPAEIAGWLAGLELDAPLACGSAMQDDQVLALATGRGGRLRPIEGGYRIELAEGFREPYLVIQSRDGRLLRLGVRDGRARLPDDFDLERAQLVASGPAGPRPVAVHEGATPTIELSGEGGARSQLATLRAAYEVSALRDNALLEREATRHAEAVCRERSARHVLDAGDPEQRLRRRGIVARVVGEAVARARTEAAAFGAIAASPSHRMALIDRRFTDVGIGVARARDQKCVVVTLAAWPRAVGGVR